MGDTFGDVGADEKPVHEVCVNDFSIGKYEVTQGQWKEIMGNNPSHFSSCGDDCPVEQVSWNDVQEFINKLNAKIRNNLLPPFLRGNIGCRQRRSGSMRQGAGVRVRSIQAAVI